MPNVQDAFQQQLQERAIKYLDSIRDYAAHRPADERERLEKQAQQVVGKGMARLRNPMALSAHPSPCSYDLAMFMNSLRKLGDVHESQPLRKAVEFINGQFYQPSELEVAVRVALPTRFEWERRYGVVAQCRRGSNPFSGPGDAVLSCSIDGIALSTSPRTPRLFSLLLDSLLHASLPADAESILNRSLFLWNRWDHHTAGRHPSRQMQ